MRSAEQSRRKVRARSWLSGSARTADPRPDFLPERHQIVLDAARPPDDCEDLVQRLIYRADLPYRKEYSAICYPPS